MKYLRRFDSHEAYSAKYPEIKEQDYCVSAVEDTCGKKAGEAADIRVYFKDPNFAAWAGDLLCWDTEKSKWVTYEVDHSVDTALDLPANLVPDAVCVVPACHTEDGKARWCALNDVTNESLRYNSLSSDATGGHYFQWAIGSWDDPTTPAGKLIDELPQACYAPRMCLAIEDDTCRTLLNKVGSFGVSDVRIPFEFGTLTELNASSVDEWMNTEGATERCTIEGYNTTNIWCDLHGAGFTNYDGIVSIDLSVRSKTSLWAPRYYTSNNYGKNSLAFVPGGVTDEVLIHGNITLNGNYINMLGDLDGHRNTQILCKLCPNGKEYPAALAASLYSQEYSPAGTWYLPASGELGYLMSKFYTIQHTLYRLSDKHVGNYSASPLDCGNYYWSSSQYSAHSAVGLDTGDGSLTDDGKFYGYLVRPFRSF